MKSYLLLLTFCFIGCTSKKTSFADKIEQHSSERVLIEDAFLDSLRLETLSILRPNKVLSYQEQLIIVDLESFSLHFIDGISLSKTREIKLSKGRGPFELLEISDVDIKGGHIILADNPQKKILVLDEDGAPINEFFVENLNLRKVKLMDDNRILIFSSLYGDQLFSILDFNGKLIQSFYEKEEDQHPLAYDGFISTQDGGIIYAGYSEPILKSIDADRESESYSVALIDNYDASANYVSNLSGESQIIRFAPGAYYSSYGLTATEELIYSAQFHNNDSNTKFIDVYKVEDGSYSKTIKTLYFPSYDGLAALEGMLYSIELSRSGYWLNKYKIQE